MKSTLARLVAAVLLAVPGVAAAYGFLLMKNALFAFFGSESGTFQWGPFLLGFLLFAAGIAFVGGWIFYRDRKRNYVAPRFKAKRKPAGK